MAPEACWKIRSDTNDQQFAQRRGANAQTGSQLHTRKA